MKNLLFLTFLLVACGTTNNGLRLHNSGSTQQIFLANQGKSLPGKCYSKMKYGDEFIWAEVICQAKLTKGLIKQIQSDLMRLGYELDTSEQSNSKFGKTTKVAIKEFQLKNNMAYGGIDWATVNKLKSHL